MIFSDARFFLIFFPISFILIAIARQSRDRLLVATTIIVISFGFYLQWTPSDFIVVVVSILFNFTVANVPRLPRRWKIWICVAGNVGYLGFLKYVAATGLLHSSISAGNLFGALGLPLGISFITFQQTMFVVDQAENRDRERNFLRYAFFVLFFPHLVAGPLIRHRLLVGQIYGKPFMRFSGHFLRVGVAYFAIGLAKKLVLAEPLALVNNTMFKEMNELSMVEAWFNAFIYSFRIYFDFSAYSDMATGLAYAMGVQFPRNFVSPYKASSVFEFWRRWHVTLYEFLRQYVYSRLLRLRFLAGRVNIAIIIVLFLSALWHGVGLGYVVWGLGHAALMIAQRQMARAGWISNRPASGVRGGLAIGTTFVLTTLLWVPFAINDVRYMGIYFERMASFTWGVSRLDLSNGLLLLVPALVAFACPNSHQLAMGGRRRWWLMPMSILLFALALPLALGRLTPPPPFIYFQF